MLRTVDIHNIIPRIQPSDPGYSEPPEFHTERSRMLRTAGIPRRDIIYVGRSEPSEFYTERFRTLETAGITHREPRCSKPLDFCTARSNTLKTAGIPQQAIQEAQNHQNSAPGSPRCSEPLELCTIATEHRAFQSRKLRTTGFLTKWPR